MVNSSMSASDFSFDRKEAVQKSAELLRDLGTAFFPLDVKWILSAFGKQIIPLTYEKLKENNGKDKTLPKFDPRLMSKDGFCSRVTDIHFRFGKEPVCGSIWYICYDHKSLESRMRFTLMHELGHICLSHHQYFQKDTLIDLEDNPQYRVADNQADFFSTNILAPAPAVFRLLQEHGFSYVRGRVPGWQLTDQNAPFLRNLGKVPSPEMLVATAFGLSMAATHRRLSELPIELEIWNKLDPELRTAVANIPYRAGWYCWVCHTRRRTTSLYCPGCGAWMHYEFQDRGRFAKPVMSLRPNGQFAFCSVCGNNEFAEDDLFCSVCGSPIVNECENALHTDGDFIRSGMWVVRGTHRCRPTDIYCGACGMHTAFGRNHGPRTNMWLPKPDSDQCRMAETSYSPVFAEEEDTLRKCPSCGSTRTMRDGRYCAECKQPLENVCSSGGKGTHSCGLNDRYCRTCGNPTIFFEQGFLPDYRESETYAALLKAEKGIGKRHLNLVMIQTDGTVLSKKQEGIS